MTQVEFMEVIAVVAVSAAAGWIVGSIIGRIFFG